METTDLGDIIRRARKRRKFSQEQLGKIVGLGKSRISKIENGAPITPRVASFILDKLGSGLQISTINKVEDDNLTEFMTQCIYKFARAKQISYRAAVNYLSSFKGLSFLQEHHEIEQTLSYNEIIDDLSRVCSKNGGNL
ncbi:MAG: DUF3791 domain-containing protein [Bacteroides oleiciplenus]|nr:DUF3791 domain-containing protein [Bacteroides oleiciplenus]